MIIKLGTNDSKPQNWQYLANFVPDYENYDRRLPGLAQQAARKKTAPVIDLHTALQDHAKLFPDGIHPNAERAGRLDEVRMHNGALIPWRENTPGPQLASSGSCPKKELWPRNVTDEN